MTQIKDMTKNGMIIESNVLVKSKEIKQTKNNDNYLKIAVQDQTGTMNAVIWNIDSNTKAQKIEEGDAIHIEKGTVSVYKDIISIVINEFDIDPSIDIDELIPSAPMSETQLKEKLEQIVDLIENKTIHTITNTLLNRVHDKFYTQPAATFMHHEFKGGLAFHTYCMLVAAHHYSKIYPFLNTDLLFSGIILHDLGKVFEINDYINTDKTFNGELLGHINIVNDLITETIIDENLTHLSDEDDKLIIELKHIVLSHHGELEWGSNVTPRTPEAQIIHYIDQIDAKMMMFQKAFSQLKETEEFTSKVFGIHNTKLYRRNNN